MKLEKVIQVNLVIDGFDNIICYWIYDFNCGNSKS
jgi:hypothetical protein